MTRPKTPTNAYENEGKYHSGDSVWVLDGGKLLERWRNEGI